MNWDENIGRTKIVQKDVDPHASFASNGRNVAGQEDNFEDKGSRIARSDPMPSESKSDHPSLADRIKQGDEQAFEDLMERAGPKLRRKLEGRARRGVASADSLSQETWLKFWLNRQSIRAETSGQLLRLLDRIASNEAVNSHRHSTNLKEGGGLTRADAGVLDHQSEGQLSPDAVAQAQEGRERLLKALPSDWHREVALLREREYTWEEIASRCGMQPGTVQKNFKRGVAGILS